ncbi:MAG TPA: signal peptidase I [Lachnospiraceae bacterium]|nr:signal peptidase I [Lachnospiraceae bacterium]
MKRNFNLENHSNMFKTIITQVLITLAEIAATIAVAYAITHYGLEKMHVSGSNMEPTLKEGDSVLINKMSYIISSIKRNDVVVVQQDGAGHNYYFIARIMGLPGETVKIEDGYLYIDGKKIKEKYKFPVMENGGLALEDIVLDDDEYFILCDNRNECEDSRNANTGNILKKNIIGKAWLRTNSLAMIKSIDEFSKDDKPAKE